MTHESEAMPPAPVGPVEHTVGRPVPERATGGLRGFGVTLTPGGARNWYAGADGVRRWANNDQPCEPVENAHGNLPAKRHCQNGGDVCLAGNRDGVCCPEDSCDIDDGVRLMPTGDTQVMPAACPTAAGCREHGCHGACLPPN